MKLYKELESGYQNQLETTIILENRPPDKFFNGLRICDDCQILSDLKESDNHDNVQKRVSGSMGYYEVQSSEIIIDDTPSYSSLFIWIGVLIISILGFVGYIYKIIE